MPRVVVTLDAGLDWLLDLLSIHQVGGTTINYNIFNLTVAIKLHNHEQW
jgi:hypothetical protein